ncbi:MAG: hypothetical protein AABW48_04795 [Nanoarchaeota archaeon]
MELKINEQKENVFLNRIELIGTLGFTGATPANTQLAEALAKEYKTGVDKIIIKKIGTKFSCHTADFLAYVYKDHSARNKAERVTAHLKKKAEEAKKAAGAKAAEETAAA